MFSSGYIPRSRITGSYGSSIFNDKPSEYFKVAFFTSSFYKKGVFATSTASLIAQLVKNLPAKKETPVWFVGWEDLLEKG